MEAKYVVGKRKEKVPTEAETYLQTLGRDLETVGSREALAGVAVFELREAEDQLGRSSFTRVTTYRLTESPYATFYTGGSDGFVVSTAAPIATGWSDPVPGRVLSRCGPAPFHGALLWSGYINNSGGVVRLPVTVCFLMGGLPATRGPGGQGRGQS